MRLISTTSFCSSPLTSTLLSCRNWQPLGNTAFFHFKASPYVPLRTCCRPRKPPRAIELGRRLGSPLSGHAVNSIRFLYGGHDKLDTTIQSSRRNLDQDGQDKENDVHDVERKQDAPDCDHDDDPPILSPDQVVASDLWATMDNIDDLPRGKPESFCIVQHYPVPLQGWNLLADGGPTDRPTNMTLRELERLQVSDSNVTLPLALMLFDPRTFPSLSRARKACRRGSILLHRGPLGVNQTTGEQTVFDPENSIIGRVAHRVYPGDVVALQVRVDGAFYPSFHYAKPPFDLPVVYEDDHFAVVNKPAGVVVYAHRQSGHGRMTVRAALPFVLKPPRRGVMYILRRPQPVHRLDKPTSGLLVVAKTKPAMVHLTRQFADRHIHKTYTAIVNGIPDEPPQDAITWEEAEASGFDLSNVDAGEDGELSRWQLIDSSLDEKSAVTLWRARRYARSLRAREGYLTLVEMKPMTGRYHQLRRHMAWVRERPLVGDTEYGKDAEDHCFFQERGLFLCSNRIILDHPYFNTPQGRAEWDAMDDNGVGASFENHNGQAALVCEENGRIRVHASIDLPEKFCKFLDWEQGRWERLHDVDGQGEHSQDQ